MADIVLDVPAGLTVFALAFTQRKGRRRTALMVLAGLILLVPVASGTVRHVRAAAYGRELEKSLRHREIPVAPPGAVSIAIALFMPQGRGRKTPVPLFVQGLAHTVARHEKAVF